MALLVDIGIDPGGSFTGIVGRLRNGLVSAEIITRETTDMRPYIAEVMTRIRAAERLGTQQRDATGIRISVEGLNPPTPQMGTVSVVGLLGTAQVLGAILGAYPDAVIVPPGHNGSAPLSVYPTKLVGPTEKKGTGKYRHARSAWDVAGKADMYQTLDKAVKGR